MFIIKWGYFLLLINWFICITEVECAYCSLWIGQIQSLIIDVSPAKKCAKSLFFCFLLLLMVLMWYTWGSVETKRFLIDIDEISGFCISGRDSMLLICMSTCNWESFLFVYCCGEITEIDYWSGQYSNKSVQILISSQNF